MEELTPWHRLFGLHWVDFFHGMPVHVELEKDLSLKQQLLDVVIIRKEAAILSRRLPDGFEDLAHHNLITFKSHQDTLDGWALNELIGHYVNYRKQSSPSMQELLDESEFRLYAVCVRFPQALSQQVKMTQVLPGVYEVQHFGGNLRVIVVHQLSQQEHNANLHLFSARVDQLKYGAEHYKVFSNETSSLLYKLLERYRQEGPSMPDVLQEFVRQTIKEVVSKASPEERLQGLSPEERVKGLSADELLKALSTEAREALIRKLNEGNGSS